MLGKTTRVASSIASASLCKERPKSCVASSSAAALRFLPLRIPSIDCDFPMS